MRTTAMELGNALGLQTTLGAGTTSSNNAASIGTLVGRMEDHRGTPIVAVMTTGRGVLHRHVAFMAAEEGIVAPTDTMDAEGAGRDRRTAAAGSGVPVQDGRPMMIYLYLEGARRMYLTCR